jgi:predicted ABC-class ATPase
VADFVITVDRVAPDPFAGPSRVRLAIALSSTALNEELVASGDRRSAVEDWVARRAARALEEGIADPASRGDLRAVRLQELGAAIVGRSACRITQQAIELRLLVALPARGRRILGPRAAELLVQGLPRLGTASLLFSSHAREQASAAAANVENHRAIQQQLSGRGLVAFLARGSLLARASGAAEEEDPPLSDGREVPLDAPASLSTTFDVPHGAPLTGLGVPAGVTLIVGGAFHGKSTLLDAIARGVHPHRLGDGRERVVTVPEAVVVRAEDGRSVRGVDISAFLGELPSGMQASRFDTDKASGSTSQAASVIEAIECGARCLLLDEDRCATNFMVRDGRMQRLVPRPDEPIIPYIDRVRELWERFGISTILVTGGTGDYLEVADTVIGMRDYHPTDLTPAAREVVRQTRTMRLQEEVAPIRPATPRVPSLNPRVSKGREARYGVRGPRGVRAGPETIDLSALEQIAETGQVRAIARLLRVTASELGKEVEMCDLLDRLEQRLDRAGMDGLDRPAAYDLSRPRRYEMAATINRWRALVVERRREIES